MSGEFRNTCFDTVLLTHTLRFARVRRTCFVTVLGRNLRLRQDAVIGQPHLAAQWPRIRTFAPWAKKS